MSNEDILIGIDFGTTNSAACIYKDGKFQIIPSAEGYDYFPSVVAVNENGDPLVGYYAKKQMVSNASNSVSEFKLEMGGTNYIKFNGEEKYPQEIAALVLARIKRDAELYLGEPVNKTVISVPASFDNDARNATIEAGEIAGFEVEALVDEPTAACLTYSVTKKFLGTILVFDMGGGTLDITIGSFDGSELVPKVTTGARVGGRNITLALYEYLKRDFEEHYGLKLEDYITPKYDPCIKLYEEAENAKIELSSTKITNVHIDSILMTAEGERINLDKEVKRVKLNELSNQVVKRSKEKVIDALNEAKLTKEDIGYLVFVGGPTKMPLIRETIEKVLGKSAAEGIDPMVCVAQGASMYKGGPITVGTINSLTLSVVVNEKESDPLIPKNTPLPAEVTKEYKTMRDNQTSVNIQIVEGESILAKENHTLHSFTLRGLPPRPKGEVAIEVKLKVDSNGIIGLSAKELSNNNKLSTTFDSSNRMSREEIKKAGLDTQDLIRDYDEKIKQKNIINDAEEAIFEGKKLIADFGDRMLISDKNMVNENIEKIEGLLVNPKNFELIKLYAKDLKNLIEKIESEDLYY